MPREFQRSRRVGEQIHRLLSEMLIGGIKDPRLSGVSFTEVEASRDLAHATVFFNMLDPDQEHGEALRALQSAAGAMRSRLGKSMKIRRVPELHFRYDDSAARGARLTSLIDEAIARDRRGVKDPADDPTE